MPSDARRPRDELRQAALPHPDVEDRLVGGIAAEVRLVGNDQAPAREHRARWRVERHARAVLTELRSRGEPGDFVPTPTDLDDLIASREGDVDVPGASDRESVGTVSGPALPDPANRPRTVVAPDAHRIELARRRIAIAAPGGALLREEQPSVVARGHDPRGSEHRAVEAAIREP